MENDNKVLCTEGNTPGDIPLPENNTEHVCRRCVTQVVIYPIRRIF